MKPQKAKIGIMLFFPLIIAFTSCNFLEDDEPTDIKKTVTLFISAETGYTTGMTETMHECMLVKEKGQSSWKPLAFEAISGFTYEKGYEYELLVTKTIYSNPPSDGGAYAYELIDIISKDSRL